MTFSARCYCRTAAFSVGWRSRIRLLPFIPGLYKFSSEFVWAAGPVWVREVSSTTTPQELSRDRVAELFLRMTPEPRILMRFGGRQHGPENPGPADRSACIATNGRRDLVEPGGLMIGDQYRNFGSGF